MKNLERKVFRCEKLGIDITAYDKTEAVSRINNDLKRLGQDLIDVGDIEEV